MTSGCGLSLRVCVGSSFSPWTVHVGGAAAAILVSCLPVDAAEHSKATWRGPLGSPRWLLRWAAWEPPGPAPSPPSAGDSSQTGVSSLGSRELLEPSFLGDQTRGRIPWAGGSHCALRALRQKLQKLPIMSNLQNPAGSTLCSPRMW